MNELTVKEFGRYFRALHDYEPFPWQARLAAQVIDGGAWPDLLDIPTGLGKTSVIDVALFALALRPDLAPRRIILIVDRRVVVDQAGTHARALQQKLAGAKDGILSEVAESLRSLWGGAPQELPFEVAVLRGGMPRDEAWTHRPDRAVVAVSTVDQVGSRLLFRGYGVSAGMAPVHAGLLGNDTLLLLDEVQLSTAFAETLQAVQDRWRRWREGESQDRQSLPDRWAFVRMSATPVGGSAERDVRFGLEEDDLAHPVILRRRSAEKPASLASPIATNKNDAEKTQRAIVDAFASTAERHVQRGSKRLAVIVNRVATARHIHEELKTRLAKQGDVVLLTGRMRPLDRLEVFGESHRPGSVAARVTAGLPRSSTDRLVVVVSTQTIEAGADFDFDALVTECASLDALRQRFGRLDRRGDSGEASATVLVRKDQATDSADDPVYGSALAKTWTWLEARSGEARIVDFGIASFPALDTTELTPLCSPVQHAPILLPAHVDAWAQTNPRGEPEPDVSLWLHGPQRGTPEVRVVWRADIDAEQLSEESSAKAATEYACASLAVSPPSSLESISVPLPAFRAWIAEAASVDIADVEGAESALSKGPGRRPTRHQQSRPYFVVEKSGARLCRTTQGAYPEATVVVPASYGGIRDGTWNPEATDPVRDLGDVAQLVHRGRPVLRLHPHLTPTAPVPCAPTLDDPEFKSVVVVRQWLESGRETGGEDWRLLVQTLLRPGARLRVIELGSSGLFAALGRRKTEKQLEAYRRTIDFTDDVVSDDDDSASHIGREVSLVAHLGDVDRWVRAFAKNLGLPQPIADDIALAARLHDIGKADPRFQRMLHGGSAVRAAASTQLLAKSRADAGDRAAREQARQRANYPDGYRHELLSVAMLDGDRSRLARAHDPELVLHLVGSHHGWCRPFAPGVLSGPSLEVQLTLDGEQYAANAAHTLATVDSGIADRYWLLTQRYGWWTLAWFEALVRLADHRASEESARSGPNSGEMSERESPSPSETRSHA